MYYITLDLEWNQAYAQKALAVQRQLSSRLRGEVIQIGAVKLDKSLRICGSYQIIVKPKYFKKLHRHVSELTGITQEQMDVGTPLITAAESFKRWCGDDFVFLTWGPDDVPMLKENFNVNDIDYDWLDHTYDLQKIFARQTDDSSKQRSLEFAMEHFEIPMNLPAHDALNDAYFTALVAQKLNVEDGIRTYNDFRGEFLESTVIGDADAGDDGYVTISEMLDDEVVKSPKCPICHSQMHTEDRVLHSKGQKYTFHFKCEKDGDMLLVLRLRRNFNETWRAKRTIAFATEESLEEFKRGIERTAVKRKMRQRKSRGPRLAR
ncbi:MAG: exonuclease domain-containing protein [Clostridia bacterium]|nr:exonuclease domain-containing protein [Clostridia bacterium]